jgi:hypothetical protein
MYKIGILVMGLLTFYWKHEWWTICVRLFMCIDRANFGCKPRYNVIDCGILFSNDTFNFVKPYLGCLLTKLNDLDSNICIHKMSPIQF